MKVLELFAGSRSIGKVAEELLYFANMLYATSKDDTKRVNSIVDGIHKLKQ